MMQPLWDSTHRQRMREEMSALVAQGHTVHVMTADRSLAPQGAIPHVVGTGAVPAGTIGKLVLFVRLLVKTLKLVPLMEPELFHAHSYDAGLVGVVLRKRAQIPFVFEGDASFTARLLERGLVTEGSLVFRAAERLEKFVHDSAQVIVTRTVAAKSDLILRCNVPSERVQIIAEAVDTRRYRPFPREQARGFLGLKTDETCVVCMGGPDPQAVDLLLSAMVVLRSKRPKLRVLVVNSQADEYKSKASALGLEKSITVASLGDGPQASTWLSAGDVAVAATTSKLEGNGRLFDSMACAVPTVAFDTPVNRESLGDLGVFARRDTADLAARIEQVLDNPQESASRGEMMRVRVEIEHSLERLRDDLSRAYGRARAPVTT